jgi:hypothetical protein
MSSKQRRLKIPKKDAADLGLIILVLVVAFLGAMVYYGITHRPSPPEAPKPFVLILENRAGHQIDIEVFFNGTEQFDDLIDAGEDLKFTYHDIHNVEVSTIYFPVPLNVTLPGRYSDGIELHIRYYDDGSVGYATRKL